MNSAYLYLSGAILLWAAVPLSVTSLTYDIPVEEVSFLATLFAVIVFSVILAAGKKFYLFKKYRKKDYARMSAMGFLGIFPYTMFYYYALSLAPSSNAGEVNIINYLWPVWIMLMAPLVIRESLTIKKLLGIIISFSGAYLIISGGKLNSLTFDHISAYLSAGVGAFFWAMFSLYCKKYNYEAFSSMLIYNISATIGFGLTCLIKNNFILPDLQNWLMLLILGGMVNGVGFVMWVKAIAKGDTEKISSLVFLTPFVSLLYLAASGKGDIKLFQLAALLIIISGPIIQSLNFDTMRKLKRS